jgi:hypothetical protein
MKKLFYFLIFFIFFINLANAETIIYDNISTSNYKLLKIDDLTNIKYINEYPYEVYINNSYLGSFKKDENIFVPDNSSITIFLPQTINIDITKSYDVGKVYLTLGIMYFLGFFIVIVLIVVAIKKIWK